ncbi:MAG TPA: DUF3325 family protein [Methylosinus sp.]|jgi:hypothetical protein
MSEIPLLASFGAAALGFLALALSLPRHWRDVTGRAELPRFMQLGARAAGFGLLTTSLAFCLLREGVELGALLWPLSSGVGALSVTSLLALRNGRARMVSRGP